LWAAVSAGYSALLSSSYFERINDDDDDEVQWRIFNIIEIEPASVFLCCKSHWFKTANIKM